MSRQAEPTPQQRTLMVGLTGQPNVGKSTLFNLLTGLSQHVGNWPGKTVERKEGMLSHNKTRMRLVDLPGTYSLTSHSLEEQVARDFIIQEHPDIIVMVADASSLERNLYLLAELLILRVPVVLALNMLDVAEAQGIQIEPHVLEAALGLPVVPMVATRNQGLAELVAAIGYLACNPDTFHPVRPQIAVPHRRVLDQLKEMVAGQVPAPFDPDWVALKLLEGDAEITRKAKGWAGERVWPRIEALLSAHEDAVLDIASGRYEWIGRMVRAAVTRPRLGQVSLTDKLDRVAVHPLWGLVLLFSVFAAVFWFTFTLAVPLQEWLDVTVVGQARAAARHLLAGAPDWLAALVAEGVLGGAGLVLTFLPVLAVFFGALALLEDTGYLARSAYVMDRFMHALGLHGKSFLPLFLGFGCNVPAVMGARVIESRGGRLLTILLAPLVPCSARLAVLAFLAPAFFGTAALPVALALVALNLLVLALAGITLNHTLFRGQHMAFIMELPLYHMPNARTIGASVWNNTWAFARKAGSFILLASVVVWALSYFPTGALEQSYLARIGHKLAPLGELMGMDWRMMVALIAGFVAKENVIATLGILYGQGGGGLAHTLAAQVSPASALAFLTVTMLFIPCLATVAVVRQETGSWRWALFDIALLLAIALVAGILVYHGAGVTGMGY
ncbi:MAG: ferrous iron transport protein B [Sulfuricella sp.]|nr:ferrous iron transport protein B [Sulfuricella sp.]